MHGDVLQRRPTRESRTDRIDRVLTNRVLGIPVFLAVMYVVFVTITSCFVTKSIAPSTFQRFRPDGDLTNSRTKHHRQQTNAPCTKWLASTKIFRWPASASSNFGLNSSSERSGLSQG